MTDMRQAARDLYEIANDMDNGRDALDRIRAAKRVMDKHGVRQALVNPPANMGTANQGRRYLSAVHTAFGKVEGGHKNPVSIGAVSAILRKVAGECAKW